MNTKEFKELVDRIYELIGSRYSFNKLEIYKGVRAQYIEEQGLGVPVHFVMCADGQFNRAFHAACMRAMRAQSVVFQPDPTGESFDYRSADASQATDRAAKFRRTSTRKLDRAIEVARAARDCAGDPMEKKRAEALEFRMRNEKMIIEQYRRSVSRARPKGL